MFSEYFSRFRADEDGAVTVDWVVLTGALVGLGIAVLSSVAAGATDRGDRIEDCVEHGYGQLVNATDQGYLERIERAKAWCTDNTY